MNSSVNDLQIIFSRDLDSLKKETELIFDDELLWETVPGITNSFGNIVLHVCGNLQYFIGSVLGNTGYERTRDLEFSKDSGSARELIHELDKTSAAVQKVLQNFSEEKLNTNFPVPVGGYTIPTLRFLLHLATHLSYHLGQANYIRRIVTGSNESAGSLSVKELAV